ncbi:MAG: heavy-metal-associated domain-containing protein [Desulfurococcales archaeon]|nr:heavy-metal-associated domain-containing protein [Desulfurococcales archaeon]
MKIVRLKIEGMHCDGCASTVKLGLKEVKGVREAEVDLSTGIATVVIDDSLQPEKLLEAEVFKPPYTYKAKILGVKAG